MAGQEALQEALAAWPGVLGDAGVAHDAATLDRYSRTTQPAGTRPACVLFPTTVDAVQEAVRIAAAHHIPVYPISAGRNWGYGDACAPVSGAAIVDLSRMKRILEIDAELGYAVIEPGVTQQQLLEAVRERAPGYWVDCTGAGRDASVVGNALERGFGHTPYGDHVRTACGLEVVLADGRTVQTGFGHFAKARAAHVYPYGVGPILDGLFTQSNLGIVTKMGVWLYPVPEAFRCFFLRIDDDRLLPDLIEALRPLRMRGILGSAVHVGNDLRVISSIRRYPWGAAKGETPLPPVLRADLRREAGVGAWNVSGALPGTAGHVRSSVRAVRAALGGFGKLVFVGDEKLRWGRRAATALGRLGMGAVLRRQLDALEPNYGLLKGIPTDAPLAGTHWRLRQEPADAAADPRDLGCGLIWLAPVLPLRGEDAERVLALAAGPFDRHGFDLLATFTLLNERSMVAVLNVAFDKRHPEECDAAERCYAETLDALCAEGYVPYRLGIGSMPRVIDAEDPFWRTAQDIKAALDPQGLIAPGRYIPPRK